MGFSRNLIKRLINTKQLFFHGCNHYKLPSDSNRLISIISLDQGIESFILTIISELEAKLNNPYNARFKEKWDAADKKIKSLKNQELPLEKEIFTIHKTRNNAQHDGIIPSDSYLNRAVIYTEDFLRQGFSLSFNMDFDNIFLSQVIKNRDIKKHMILTEKKIANKNYKSAINELAKTFNSIYKSEGKQDNFPLSNKLDFSKIYEISNAIFRGRKDKDDDISDVTLQFDFHQIIENTIKEIETLKELVSIISLGVNLKEYLFFKNNTPQITYKQSINGTLKEELVSYNEISYSKKNCLRLFNFVYNTIIILESI